MSLSVADLPIPKDFGYVILAATTTSFVNIYHTLLTIRHRKAAGYGYPTAYAPLEAQKTSQAAYGFNCAQRAHANFVENVPTVLVTLLLGGLRFPLTAAALGVAWSALRAVYAWGYASSKLGDKGVRRYKGGAHSAPQAGLIGLALASAYLVITG